MRKAAIVIIMIAAVFSACKKSLQTEIANKIRKDCGTTPSASCKFILKNATSFDWDKMYIFHSWTTADSIASRLKIPYTGDDIYDDTERIIFTMGKKIVYEEDIDYLNGKKEILFDDVNDTLIDRKKFYTTSEAVFTIERDKDKKFSEYYLKRCTQK